MGRGKIGEGKGKVEKGKAGGRKEGKERSYSS